MADLLIKVGAQSPSPEHYQDGDVICAWTDWEIHHTHVQVLCHPAKSPTNSDGLRDDVCSETVYSTLCQWHFERLNRTQYSKTNSVTNDVQIFTLPWLDQWIRERCAHPRHRMFGQAGKERWYQTPWLRNDEPKMAKAWSAIGAHKGLLRGDHDRMPLGRLDAKVHLPMCLNESLSDIEKEEWTTPAVDGEGLVVKKRTHLIPWRDVIPPGRHGDVANRGKSFDSRAIRVPKTKKARR